MVYFEELKSLRVTACRNSQYYVKDNAIMEITLTRISVFLFIRQTKKTINKFTAHI